MIEALPLVFTSTYLDDRGIATIYQYVRWSKHCHYLPIHNLGLGQYIDKIDIWNADMRIDTIYEISILTSLLLQLFNLTNENSRYPSGKPETVMCR